MKARLGSSWLRYDMPGCPVPLQGGWPEALGLALGQTT